MDAAITIATAKIGALAQSAAYAAPPLAITPLPAEASALIWAPVLLIVAVLAVAMVALMLKDRVAAPRPRRLQAPRRIRPPATPARASPVNANVALARS